MAKLFTHHDRFHVHKVLGLLALLHYLYRFALLYRCGDAFPSSGPSSGSGSSVEEYESPLMASAGVLLHGLLSWSSLLLPLPSKRNFNAPMVSPRMKMNDCMACTQEINNDESRAACMHSYEDLPCFVMSVRSSSIFFSFVACLCNDRYGRNFDCTASPSPRGTSLQRS